MRDDTNAPQRMLTASQRNYEADAKDPRAPRRIVEVLKDELLRAKAEQAAKVRPDATTEGEGVRAALHEVERAIGGLFEVIDSLASCLASVMVDAPPPPMPIEGTAVRAPCSEVRNHALNQVSAIELATAQLVALRRRIDL